MFLTGLPACMCAMYMSEAQGGERRVLDSLKLVSYRMGAENQTQVLCQSSPCSQPQSQLSGEQGQVQLAAETRAEGAGTKEYSLLLECIEPQ